MRCLIFIYGLIFILSACKNEPRKLPFLGNPIVEGNDSTYPVISNFSFRNQDSIWVNNKTFNNKLYVADFIFLSCPSICPKMTKEMHKVYLTFEKDARVAFLSHSIDPARDSIPRLKEYAATLSVKPGKWHFVTGNEDSIHYLAEHAYYSTAFPDSIAPGGFTHSGGLLLVDKNKHIRGVYNGTNPSDTKRLISDIELLLKEQF